jgi:hypothetical protein
MSSSLDKFSDKICAQRKANGDPCHSPALHGERFCHFHKLMGKPAINIDNSPSGHSYLPVFEMMLHRRIETKEASILLYAMQVASTNMAHMNGDKGQRNGKSQNKNQENHPEPAALSAPDSLPPGTIQARGQKGRRKFK